MTVAFKVKVQVVDVNDITIESVTGDYSIPGNKFATAGGDSNEYLALI